MGEGRSTLSGDTCANGFRRVMIVKQKQSRVNKEERTR
jgi:hypothetical protein